MSRINYARYSEAFLGDRCLGIPAATCRLEVTKHLRHTWILNYFYCCSFLYNQSIYSETIPG